MLCGVRTAPSAKLTQYLISIGAVVKGYFLTAFVILGEEKMDDTMSKEKAADLLDNLIGMVDDTNGNNYDDALIMGIEALKADAVEVVRCKDCMLCQYDAIFKQHWCIGKPVKADDYCSMGVRKKDG